MELRLCSTIVKPLQNVCIYRECCCLHEQQICGDDFFVVGGGGANSGNHPITLVAVIEAYYVHFYLAFCLHLAVSMR